MLQAMCVVKHSTAQLLVAYFTKKVQWRFGWTWVNFLSKIELNLKLLLWLVITVLQIVSKSVDYVVTSFWCGRWCYFIAESLQRYSVKWNFRKTLCHKMNIVCCRGSYYCCWWRHFYPCYCFYRWCHCSIIKITIAIISIILLFMVLLIIVRRFCFCFIH